MPLSTPAGCVGGGPASPRIGPGSQAGVDSASHRQKLPETKPNKTAYLDLYKRLPADQSCKTKTRGRKISVGE
ncbi:hypothetical protein AMECASPLE_004142 [Ameca splendens]|uniref:Uncharacterized protein n=1 Tax=Ameca splendens TaxID=208324 RepID=A0ABV0YKV0_9TELE